jgi:hypothetical protein
MKTLAILTFTIYLLGGNNLFAQTYSCSNEKDKVQVEITITSKTKAEVKVKSPFQKQMKCDYNLLSNGVDTIKSFTCDNQDDGLPDVLAINEKTLQGMIEVVDQPHYDLECK